MLPIFIYRTYDSYIERRKGRKRSYDYRNKEISKYLSHCISYGANVQDSEQLTAYFKIAGNLERIDDHILNIAEALAV